MWKNYQNSQLSDDISIYAISDIFPGFTVT